MNSLLLPVAILCAFAAVQACAVVWVQRRLIARQQKLLHDCMGVDAHWQHACAALKTALQRANANAHALAQCAGHYRSAFKTLALQTAGLLDDGSVEAARLRVLAAQIETAEQLHKVAARK